MKASRLARLPTLAELQATPRAQLKCQLETKLDRAVGKKQLRLTDAKQLLAWAAAVKDRDRWRDRRTGVRVFRTRQLDPLRAEAHHIVSREDQAVRYDVRNGICLSFETHFLVERHVLRIVGSRWFVKGGTRYIDGRYPVQFVPA